MIAKWLAGAARAATWCRKLKGDGQHAFDGDLTGSHRDGTLDIADFSLLEAGHLFRPEDIKQIQQTSETFCWHMLALLGFWWIL